MAQLEGAENRISTERDRYNDAVTAFNVKVKTFPSNIAAGILGFSIRNYFQADQKAAEAPKVNLSTP